MFNCDRKCEIFFYIDESCLVPENEFPHGESFLYVSAFDAFLRSFLEIRSSWSRLSVCLRVCEIRFVLVHRACSRANSTLKSIVLIKPQFLQVVYKWQHQRLMLWSGSLEQYRLQVPPSRVVATNHRYTTLFIHALTSLHENNTRLIFLGEYN